jgi:hypothetical protein
MSTKIMVSGKGSGKSRSITVVKGKKKGRGNSSVPRLVRENRQVFSIQRTWDVGNISSAVTNTYLAYSFTLGDVPNSTEFTGMFDQYRFKRVMFVALPHCTYNPVAAAANSTTKLLITPDYDDDTVLSAENDILQYPSVEIYNFDKEIRKTITPRMAVAAYSGAFTSYANMDNQWIDAASPSVKHYGLKIVILAASTALLSGWRVFLTYDLEFRNVR